MSRIGMVHVCWLIIVIAFHADSVHAQVSIGARIGVSVASQTIQNDGAKEGDRVGPAVGLEAEWRVGHFVALRLEPMFIQKGVEIEYFQTKWRLEYDYVDVPLTVKCSSTVGGLRPYLFAGPNLGILIDSRTVLESTDQAHDFVAPSFDFSLDLGGGISVPIQRATSLEAEFRYSHGFRDVGAQATSGTINNRTIMVLVGVVVGL